MVSVNDVADRPARTLADGEVLNLGAKLLRSLDAPHVPHGRENEFVMETTTRTLLYGDLFTQGRSGVGPTTESDILGPSGPFRALMYYYAHAPHTAAVRKLGFSSNALAGALLAEGIEYLHLVELGCPRKIRERYKRDRDWGARSAGADRSESPPAH